MAKLADKNQMHVFASIIVPHPTRKGITNRISVKTFDQDKSKLAGPSLNRQWINETPKEELMGEIIGRTRTPVGKVEGSVALFATLLDTNAWVLEMENHKEIRFSHSRGHLFEACVGSDVSDSMAAEVLRTIGVKLEKNPDGEGYITGGVLTKESIDQMCAWWRKIAPGELEARMTGAPISGGGQIYPNFKREIHAVRDYCVNPDWPVFQVIDPHAAKLTFSIWAQMDPLGNIVVFAEWPSAREFGRYDAMTERPYTIQQECAAWRRIEAEYGIANANITRIGDPNRLKTPELSSSKTLLTHFAENGFRFGVNVSDDLEVGHAKVSERLYFSAERLALNKDDIGALPRLFFHERCENTINAMRGYAFKKTGKVGGSVTERVSETYKDPCDCVRYLVMSIDGKKFEDLSGKNKGRDYEAFQRGRIPRSYRQSRGLGSFGGRGVMA
jgi:hypothetical protein